jgi:hypothetical protein
MPTILLLERGNLQKGTQDVVHIRLGCLRHGGVVIGIRCCCPFSPSSYRAVVGWSTGGEAWFFLAPAWYMWAEAAMAHRSRALATFHQRSSSSSRHTTFSYLSRDWCTCLQAMQTFRNWQAQYGKDYGNNLVEEQNRLVVWQSNLDRINKHNSMDLSYKMAVNQFADLTPSEFRRLLGLRPLVNGSFQ